MAAPTRSGRASMLPTRVPLQNNFGASQQSQGAVDEHGESGVHSQDHRSSARRDVSMGVSQLHGRESVRRQSVAVPSTPATGRRSISSRTSLAPTSLAGRESLMLSGSGLGGAPTQQSRETRPVRNKAFQESMYSVLISALGENNMAGGQQIKKAVREPTQLAFVDMFQTVWKRYIDPDHNFESSKDSASGGMSAGHGTVMSKAVDEVLTLLKEINYPGMEDMTKSRLSAAGSTGNWPFCLAMLGWLVQIGDKLNDEAFPIGPKNRAADLMNPDLEMDQDNMDVDNMQFFYPFLYKTYEKFWNNQDEYPEEREELERIFDARDHRVLQELDSMRARERDVAEELMGLQQRPSPLQAAKQRDTLLVSDIKKFQDYNENYIRRKTEKVDKEIKRFLSTKSDSEAKVEALKKERDHLQKEVDEQPMTSEEYDRLENHYRTLQEQLNLLENKKAQVEAERGNVELEAYRHQNAMEEEFKMFNALGRDIDLLPFKLPATSSAATKDGLSVADELVFERGELYPDVDIKTYLRPLVARMLKDGSEKRKGVAEQKLQLGQKYDVLLDDVQRARETLSQLHKRYEMTRADIDKINQTSKEEGDFADSMEQDHQRLIHETEAAGHSAISEQTAREARLRVQHEQAIAAYNKHVTAMNEEVTDAMHRLLNLKDNVASALEKLKGATKVNGHSETA
ncbi:hypothetical protein K437DRAFT_230395 [Tilletiaria anomala UBC 951]|uniref:Kinetochore protein NDC80 n=1 Tax=Tilletiaria anomala (strain ATCC 24038 / CBS 436.72 / UBC 951) TaxID=1037660 RepID=A0A066WRE0_TILAU|nr:uncharacterized protein K437DRAFT_230395 [Tilletiaria anomala UBC 951]KDN53569.1 hypothetical protein K437DRAFT_230395 [Tilletiaria anomala UBC 951]